jgi:hypothetical protein
MWITTSKHNNFLIGIMKNAEALCNVINLKNNALVGWFSNWSAKLA